MSVDTAEDVKGTEQVSKGASSAQFASGKKCLPFFLQADQYRTSCDSSASSTSSAPNGETL
jgi:hypothetical protein